MNDETHPVTPVPPTPADAARNIPNAAAAATQVTGPRLERVQVLLDSGCITWLGATTARVKRESGEVISRSGLLRAIVGGLDGIKLSGFETETQLRRWFKRKFEAMVTDTRKPPANTSPSVSVPVPMRPVPRALDPRGGVR